MITDESMPKHGGRTAMAALFLPSTLQGRLVFLGVVLFMATALAPSPYDVFTGLLIWPMLIWAWVVAARDRRRRNQRLTIRRILTVTVGVISGYVAFSIVFSLWAWTLAVLVTAGGFSGSPISDSPAYYKFELVIVLTILAVVVWIPNRLFKLKPGLDDNENVRRVLLALMTVTASILTGVYILTLHFGGGQLSKIRWGPLIAGMVFTVVLVGPVYRSLARGCWQRGISGMFSLRTLGRHWRETLTEVELALNRAAEHRIASNSMSRAEVKSTTQDDGNTPR